MIRKEKGRPIGATTSRYRGVPGYAKNWLYPYRGVPRQYLHLYLAEVFYRYDHRREDLKPLLFKLMKQTSTQELEPTLVRKGQELPLRRSP